MYKPGIIVVIGPTAVGKSDLALELALRCGGEIINGDLGQFYTPLSIGTAKPDFKATSVAHHLFNIFNEPCTYTVHNYLNDLEAVVLSLWERNITPIIVGGSSFYMSSIYFPPAHILHQELNDEQKRYIHNATWNDLAHVDPLRASEISPADLYRIRRALTLWCETGKKPSVYKPRFSPISSSMLIHLDRDRLELHKRIEQRVITMLKTGWIEEARALLDTHWEPFIHQKGFIGYAELFEYLRGKQDNSSYQELIHSIGVATKKYAKRQITFNTMLLKKLAPYAVNV